MPNQSSHRPVSIRNSATWPLKVRRATDAIASMLMHAFQLARSRAYNGHSRIVRRLARRYRHLWDARLLRRENRILRKRLLRLHPSKRPHYAPPDRFQILLLIRLRGWRAKRAARRLVLHPNTVRACLKPLRRKGDPGLFLGRAPFNKLGQAPRWIVHRIRELVPDPHFGTRAIAMAIARNGIALSRSSVQRILREHKPPRPAAPAACRERKLPIRHILRPEQVNRTWHLDLTTFEFLWVRFYVAALLDGFSRKLLALRVYRDAPTTAHMLRLVRRAQSAFGRPRFLVTDGGSQFRSRFRKGFDPNVTRVIKGSGDKEAACRFNGKVERFIKTMKLWSRLTMFAWTIPAIQRSLNVYRNWYNTQRSMWLQGGRTPDEVWSGASMPIARPIRAHEEQPFVTVRRIDFRDDPELPKIEIHLIGSVRQAA